ncbi:glutathione S-transferase U8-like [Durio zibethinus]|uniref:glutathione transferase n=1 Tax=Durio zibethinus TaxID=66656 RepID=A0A6P6ART9_DURZI|nr:glutathione S-transferase U8-like [Durio zibethinus]
MAEEVKVFGACLSPFSRRVELALRLKGVPYEYIEEDIFKNKSPLLLKYNPVHKKVPVLLHNRKPIAESLVILEYIEETWKGNPILPEDPYEKAKARFWTKFTDEKCLPALRKAGWSPENEREKAVEEACECLKTLESSLNGKRFFGGDTVGMVDIAANFIGFWLTIMQEATGRKLLSAEKFPELFKWTDEFVSCSVVKESLPPKDKLLAFYKARVAEAKEAQTNAPK